MQNFEKFGSKKAKLIPQIPRQGGRCRSLLLMADRKISGSESTSCATSLPYLPPRFAVATVEHGDHGYWRCLDIDLFPLDKHSCQEGNR